MYTRNITVIFWLRSVPCQFLLQCRLAFVVSISSIPFIFSPATLMTVGIKAPNQGITTKNTSGMMMIGIITPLFWLTTFKSLRNRKYGAFVHYTPSFSSCSVKYTCSRLASWGAMR